MEKEIQAGFSGEDFNDATSSRFDGGDSSFPENLQEKRPRPNAQNYFALQKSGAGENTLRRLALFVYLDHPTKNDVTSGKKVS